MNLKISVVLLLFLTSCTSTYKIGLEDKIDIRDYAIYVFRLCEKTNKLGNQRFYLCDVDCLLASRALLNTEKTITTEELYLLVSRTTNDIIYLTTRTNRSFDKTPDNFNSEAHKDYVLVNELENVYFGKRTAKGFVFKNNNETLTFIEAPEKISCKVAITALLSESTKDSPINNKIIPIENIYSVPFEFNQSNRHLATKLKHTTIYDPISSIVLTKRKVLFKGGISTIEASKHRRLKYHPDFDK